MSWAGRVAGWFPELVAAQARSRTWPELEGRRELIAKMLDTHTLATVHQRLRDEHGLSASEHHVRSDGDDADLSESLDPECAWGRYC